MEPAALNSVALTGIALTGIALNNGHCPNGTALALPNACSCGSRSRAATSDGHVRSSRECSRECSREWQLFIIDEVIPSFPKPVALICVAEKGNLSIELSIELSEAGHSSAPPREGAISILSEALSKLQRNPFPTHSESLALMFGALRGGFRWPLQLIVSNLWLFTPLLTRVLASKPKTATLVRTTTALTIVNAGTRHNVMPTTATATANFRIHPMESVESTLAYVRRVIADDRITITTLLSTQPAPVSSSTHPAFSDLATCVHEVFPHVAVAPGLFVAASDSKHFWKLTPQIFRFNPVTLHNSETSMFHGFNERITVRNHAQCVAFFRAFHLKQSARSVPA